MFINNLIGSKIEKGKREPEYKILILIIILFEIIFSIVITYFKYLNQNLPFHSFSILKLPNLLTLFEFVLIVLILIVGYKNTIQISHQSFYFILSGYLFSCALIIIGQLFLVNYREALFLIYIYLKIIIISYLIILNLKDKYPILIKTFVCSIVITVVILSIIISYILFIPTYNDKIHDKSIKSDIAVIFGAAVWGKNRPSPIFKERILKGLELYKKGIVKYLAVTGGYAKSEISEAEVAKKFLIKQGVDESAILFENGSSSTIEQVHFIRDIISGQNKIKKIIIVSDFFHLRRISEICIFNDIYAISIYSHLPSIEENNIIYVLRESIGLILFWKFGI
jgi:vancomycin permeability regulator SanA